MDLDEDVRAGARHGMQAVDVLGDEALQPAPPLELREGEVPAVGGGGPSRVGHAPLPRLNAHGGVGQVGLDVGETLGGGVPGPDAVGSPEVRDPGLRRDAGAGEGHDVAGVTDPAGDGGEVGEVGYPRAAHPSVGRPYRRVSGMAPLLVVHSVRGRPCPVPTTGAGR